MEFLPLATELYRQNQALLWLEKLDTVDSPVCVLLAPRRQGGFCSQYHQRGLICRLFGFSARTNKHGLNELVTCDVMKTEQAEAFAVVRTKIEGGDFVPLMRQYYMQIYAIDVELARVFYPINKAIQKAIEIVLQYYAYRNQEE